MLLHKALLKDTNRCWESYKGAERTRKIHLDWSTGVNMGMITRYGRSLVHGEACGNRISRSDGYRGFHGSRLCRGGSNEDETLDHVLFRCPCYSRERSRIFQRCQELEVKFSISNVFTKKELL